MQTAVTNQIEMFKFARQQFIAAKEALGTSSDDIMSDEASALIDRVFATRDRMIEQGLAVAKQSRMYDDESAAALKELEERLAKSPAVREKLTNVLLAIEVK